ncbi:MULTISPECIES: hypothetical protein [unclassified Rhizobium]|uniref:hypothetical protein n=1 Tax=unclassified Rhizobium TaxID=2613769 RepID=UPI00177DD113|nr:MULTISPECIES: hypothetical protein [unclassified Rhizobium]MBD8687067.1 hypothetical protein [Rhizobium sp. CFBP 13644]MBD8691130.1 hypothetical protein [Rhizobium sp. CFBP 13717]
MSQVKIYPIMDRLALVVQSFFSTSYIKTKLRPFLATKKRFARVVKCYKVRNLKWLHVELIGVIVSGSKILPEKITTPIQLVATWFVMLVALVSALLGAAHWITRPEWASAFLIILTGILIAGVLIFVAAMLTVFRPHLQEAKEYAEWLKDKGLYSDGILRASQVSEMILQQVQPQEAEAEQTIWTKSEFQVSISQLPGDYMLYRNLVNAGFDASIYQASASDDFDAHAAIWIGSLVPVSYAVEAIKLAVTTWPHLKFLHLSNDGPVPPDYVHKQLYLGGATKTAWTFGLMAWPNDELLRLDDTMEVDEFHRLVRARYIGGGRNVKL